MYKASDQKFCADCGEVILAKAVICPKCGCRQSNSTGLESNSSGRNKYIAAIIAFCLGAIGIHRFYLGRPFSGVMYILFCWTGIPMFISFIECILLLLKSDEQFARDYP